jgi:hypothetical protein
MAARKAQNKEGVALTGAASRGYRSRWLVLGMVRRHPSFCVTILIDPKNPLWPLFSQNPTKYHDMTPCVVHVIIMMVMGRRCRHRFLPAKPAPKSKAACIAYFNSNTTRAYTGGAIQMSMAHTQTKDPVIHALKNAPCFLYLGTCLCGRYCKTAKHQNDDLPRQAWDNHRR